MISNLQNERWFSDKGRPVESVGEVDSTSIPGVDCRLVLLQVSFRDGTAERYLVVRGSDGTEPGVGSGAWAGICQFLLSGESLPGVAGGSFRSEPGTGSLPDRRPQGGVERSIGDDQTNSLIVIDEWIVLKLFRKLNPGEHPEAELLEALSGSGLTPALAGSLSYAGPDGLVMTLALGLEFIEAEDFGFEGPIVDLVDYLGSGREAQDLHSATERFAEAGTITARLHVELTDAFGFERAKEADLLHWRQQAQAWLDEAAASEEVTAVATIARWRPSIEKALQGFDLAVGTGVTRIHGDLHIGQFLNSNRGLVVIDFEGDPLLPLADRRRPDTTVRDLACLLRSIDHVASAAGRRVHGDPEHPDLDAWIATARSRTLSSYRDSAGSESFGPDPRTLHTLEVAKECAEFVYATRTVPDWAYAPAAGMRRLFATDPV
jgi:maltokinase